MTSKSVRYSSMLVGVVGLFFLWQHFSVDSEGVHSMIGIGFIFVGTLGQTVAEALKSIESRLDDIEADQRTERHIEALAASNAQDD